MTVSSVASRHNLLRCLFEICKWTTPRLSLQHRVFHFLMIYRPIRPASPFEGCCTLQCKMMSGVLSKEVSLTALLAPHADDQPERADYAASVTSEYSRMANSRDSSFSVRLSQGHFWVHPKFPPVTTLMIDIHKPTSSDVCHGQTAARRHHRCRCVQTLKWSD